jgi:hypothetical protein
MHHGFVGFEQAKIDTGLIFNMERIIGYIEMYVQWPWRWRASLLLGVEQHSAPQHAHAGSTFEALIMLRTPSVQPLQHVSVLLHAAAGCCAAACQPVQ